MKMRVVILALVFCLFPLVVQASPFLRCDQYTTGAIPSYFKVSMDGGAYVQSPTYVYPNETGVSLHYDLGSLAVGNHTVKVQACIGASDWDVEVCSADSLPFVFTKPAAGLAPGVPAHIKLSK
jgi:hypothetical protein